MDVPPEYKPGYMPQLVECPECGEDFPAEDGPFCPHCDTDLREHV